MISLTKAPRIAIVRPHHMSINVTELARRLKVPTHELLEKLPELGFSLGRRAIKVNDKEANDIARAWRDYKRKEAVQRKHKEQQEREDRRKARLEATKDQAIQLPAVLSVRDFAQTLNMPLTEVMKELMRAGVFANMNDRIDFDTASIVAGDMGFHVTNADPTKKGDVVDQGTDRLQEVLSQEEGVARPPVVVVMGHVDHGKTKLLDAIRDTHVMESEAGGITQHIGAYQAVRKDQLITFIDTPGHEAFTVMRSRGAQVADIAILVVAADDGVQPQTREAIDIIRSAKLPMIVAINKVDKPEADVERVKRELSDLNLIPEEWGGKTIMVSISAKQSKNIDALLDGVLLVYEVEKERMVANPDRAAIGTIIESHIDKGAGPVATVLIQSGTLKAGDTLGVRSENYGRVRAMHDHAGADLKMAGPSVPVRVLGWKVAPTVGDVMEVADPSMLQKTAKSKMRSSSMSHVGAAPIVQAQTEGEGEGKQILNLVVKADVLGSMEAILGMYEKVKSPDVGVAVVSKALGHVTEADVQRAEATGALIIAFGVKVPPAVENLAREKHVEILRYEIIYKMFEDVVARLQGLLKAEVVMTELGKMEVLAVFNKTDNGMIVGGRMTVGSAEKESKLRVFRNNELIGDGTVAALRIGKEVVSDLRKGDEGGVQYVGKTKIEIGDTLEFYREDAHERKLVVEGANA